MSIFVAFKVVHVLSAIVAVGVSVGSVYWLDRAGRDRDRLVWVLEGARRLEQRVANPAYGVLLLSGIALVSTGGFRLDQGWLALAVALYLGVAVFGIVIFAPAVRRRLGEAAADPTSAAYDRIARRTAWYSRLTTGVVVAIVLLMVAKPF